MSPNSDDREVLDKVDKFEVDHEKPTIASPRKYKIIYKGFLSFIYFHLAAVYGIYLLVTSVKTATIAFNVFAYIFAALGATAGAHRLWSHRSYKAKLPLQIILMLFQSMCDQFSVIRWVQQHRLHHKYCDTDADPHNASRGFFFSHIGWLMVKSHDDLRKRWNNVDISDVKSNPVLKFQYKYAYPVIGTMCFILPTVIPMTWGETLSNAWHVNMLRYMLNIHATFLVNSAAHKFGSKPYNNQILPTQNNFVSLIFLGEGFHNYHHTFPWDYKTAELGNNMLNFTTHFINLCAYIGWAYDLKTVNEEIVKARAIKTGDGTDSWGRIKASE